MNSNKQQYKRTNYSSMASIAPFHIFNEDQRSRAIIAILVVCVFRQHVNEGQITIFIEH